MSDIFSRLAARAVNTAGTAASYQNPFTPVEEHHHVTDQAAHPIAVPLPPQQLAPAQQCWQGEARPADPEPLEPSGTTVSDLPDPTPEPDRPDSRLTDRTAEGLESVDVRETSEQPEVEDRPESVAMSSTAPLVTTKARAPAWTALSIPIAPRLEAEAEDNRPAVKIHIGRLDVRTNLEAPSPPHRERGTKPSHDALTLHDYLRGKRTR